MEAKFEHKREDVIKIQAALLKFKGVEVTPQEAFNIWDRTSRKCGGVCWLLVPSEEKIIEYIEEAPGFKGFI